MPRRSTQFVPGEYYHVYNHGIEARNLLVDQRDADRLVHGLQLFNTIKPLGSIAAQSYKRGELPSSPEATSDDKLVDIICYCFNPNHYHLLLREVVDGGTSEFMQRLGGGFALYYNWRHKRHGPLYQDRFQAKHIDDNDYLIWVSAYVNLNDKVHQLSFPEATLVRSSWNEYAGKSQQSFCATDVILEQYSSASAYEAFARSALELMQQRKDNLQVLAFLGVE